MRGVPVTGEGIGPERAQRRRSWPNRAGILETGADTDTVDWYADLADPPPNGTVVRHREPFGERIDERIAWFRGLLKTLEQIRGVTAPITPEAPCGIVLTPGIPARGLAAAADRFPRAIDALPNRLAEFPGGIQLRVTPEAWLHADAYAVSVQEVLEEKD
ncbi:MAG: hypothetical protein ACR2NG_02685 [Acidimicrobiia bacterium]